MHLRWSTRTLFPPDHPYADGWAWMVCAGLVPWTWSVLMRQMAVKAPT
jgi:hypothetical protein